MPDNLFIGDEETNLLRKELREEEAAAGQQKSKEPAKKFETLPDGDYIGRVYIVPDTVANPNSPNAGRKKLVFNLSVTEGEYKGKMAYNHRIIMPSNLANRPSDETQIKDWQEKKKKYLRQTDRILSNCGVNTAETDMDQFVINIAQNNNRNPKVNFTMRNGVPYINNLADGLNAEDSEGLFSETTAPNGDDLPLE